VIQADWSRLVSIPLAGRTDLDLVTRTAVLLGNPVTQAGIGAADLALVIHGTTLATNALIERKGARTALVTTDGFRDSLEIAYEHRFEQYDLYMERPEPLVARPWRFEVPEAIAIRSNMLVR
jgi:N-methylhydantoinase A